MKEYKIKKWRLKMLAQDGMVEGYLNNAMNNSAIYGRVNKRDASVYTDVFQIYVLFRQMRGLGYKCGIRPRFTKEERDLLFSEE